MRSYWRRPMCYERAVNAFESVTVCIPATLCRMPRQHQRRAHFRINNGMPQFVRACQVGRA